MAGSDLRHLRGDVMSHTQMCAAEGRNLQRGMNFRKHEKPSVILMSVRRGAPYADRIEDQGRTLIYEGHDVPQVRGGPDPKSVDQVLKHPGGSPTENGKFFAAARRAATSEAAPELVHVYEKIRSGIWAYNGVFRLVDAWPEVSGRRTVYKFRLELADDVERAEAGVTELPHDRMIPSEVKLEVWKRDNGRCVQCGTTDNLHFDHVIPFSLGGSSMTATNVQLLCARHNLEKRARIA